jgi:hypothetical protein
LLVALAWIEIGRALGNWIGVVAWVVLMRR